MIDLLGALIIGFGVWGAFRSIRDALAARRVRRLAAEAAAEQAIKTGSYREIDAVLALHSGDLSNAACLRLEQLRADLYLERNQ